MEKTKNLRVTVSMPEHQVERMDNQAEKLGISRNAFMQIAIAEYVSNRELLSEQMLQNVLIQLMEGKK